MLPPQRHLRRRLRQPAHRLPLLPERGLTRPGHPSLDRLPIDEVIEQVVAALSVGNVVVHAPTGAGKTTRVPRALLDAGQPGLILVAEPRQVAARAAAARMAEELGEPLGHTVGYQVRFDRVASERTRILVVTEGVLLRRLVSDPFLEGVGAVLFDEVHERGLDADLALSMTRHVQREVRDDLRVGALSATLDVGAFAAFLDAPVVRSEGRSWPVDVRYLPRPDTRPLEQVAGDAVRTALAEHDGDVLVFLPGVPEIEWTREALVADALGAEVVVLHGRLPPAAQDLALRPGRTRRVVLSTNVAETSVTIPGVRVVVDAGLVRVNRHDPRHGLDRLVTEDHSKASADQRAGRAGRTAPGVALRLWTLRQHEVRPDHDAPEVRRADLAGAVLTLLAAGEPDPATFPWVEPPPAHGLQRAQQLLERLGAVRGGQLTDVGRVMASLPAHPRVARMLVEAHGRGVLDESAGLAAVLSDRMPFRRTGPSGAVHDDLDGLLDALDGRPSGWVPVSRPAVERTREVARQLREGTRRALGPSSAPPGGEDDVRRALLCAWPDRVARRREADRYTLASGRGARLHRDVTTRSEWLLALDVMDGEDQEARIHLATALEPAWLEAPDRTEVSWDPARDRVVATRRARWGALVLREQEGVDVPEADVRRVLGEAARANPARVLPDDPDAARLIARVRFLARERPDLDLPDVTDDGLVALAVERAGRARRLADLRALDWHGALLGEMTWTQRQALDTGSPERLEVPSGSSIRLEYPPEGPPVLPVRMQELFGLSQTPRVAGRPVLLHLLAPNGRPQQVTDDLGGFWARAWPEIRKELRGRYPKHAWPEDPAHATAERRPQRRPKA